MRGIVPSAIVFLLAVLICGPTQAKGPGLKVSVGNWQGGSYTNDTTGAFSHCAAGTTYNSGIHFMVSVDRGLETWGLGFYEPSWKLAVGNVVPLTLIFDGKARYNVQANVLSTDMAYVPMPNTSALVNSFRRAWSMSVIAQGQVFQFDLNGTAALVPALVDCVRASLAGAQEPAHAVGQPNPAVKTDPAAETALQMEAIQIATNFILTSRLRNPRVETRPGPTVDLVSSGIVWRADEALGSVRIIPEQSGVKGLDVAAAVAAADSKDCKGKFATGRDSELIDSDVVFRGFSSCKDSDGERTSQYFIVPRGEGGFVVFSVVATPVADSSMGVESDARVSDFRNAALTASSSD